MTANFKIRYFDNNGKPHVRFTETLSAALVFVESAKKKSLGKNFQLIRLKYFG